jgi:hypothetical protein
MADWLTACTMARWAACSVADGCASGTEKMEAASEAADGAAAAAWPRPGGCCA